ncbi:SGNH hydrolase domain-containing protein [Curtobacterium flaccumfaciens]|nr:SGNH hydrolase domain-containing protein [Curtobacterium flaccumfaciens]
MAAGATWFVIPLSILLATVTHGLLERPFMAFPSGALDASPEARRARKRWARTAFRGRARTAVVALGTVATVLGLVAIEESRPIETNVVDASQVTDGATEDAPSDGESPPDELTLRQQALAAALESSTWPDVRPSVDAVSAPGYLDALPRSDEWAETLGCSSAWTSSSLDDCSFGAQDGKTALVVGDSSGAFTAPALRAIAERSGSEWRIVVATRYSCPWVSERISFVDDVEACEEHKRKVLDVAAELRPDVILAINVPSTTVERPGGGTASHATWARWTADMAERTPSIRTVAMVPNPYGPDVRTCAAPQSTPARCVTTDAVNRARASAMAEALGEDDVVDSSPVWCVTGKCPAFVGHELVRVDALHASPEASVHSAEALRAVLRRHDVL